MEDIETTGQTKLHGPVQATPQAGASTPPPAPEGGSDGSGISYGDPTKNGLNEYQKALIRELESGNHARLGDTILAAQTAYADSRAMPELLEIYHLLGDPGLRLR